MPARRVDLSLTMTNGTNSVTAGGSTSYTIVVANTGASAAAGAVVTQVNAAGLAETSLTCAASGGAVCPSGPTVAQFETGLSVPTLPAGGIVTFTLDATVTAASGTVSITATMTLPAGVTDTNHREQFRDRHRFGHRRADRGRPRRHQDRRRDRTPARQRHRLTRSP